MESPLPLALFVNTRRYFKVLDALFRAIKAEPSGAPSMYLRAGTIPYLGTETVGAVYTEYKTDIGRRRTAEAVQPPVARERHLRSQLYASLRPLYQSPGFNEDSLLTTDFECISLSSVPRSLELSILSDPVVLEAAHLISRFDPSDTLQFAYLWQRLTLRGLVLDGKLLKPLEDDPVEIGIDPNGRTYLVPPFLQPDDSFASGWFHVVSDQDRPAVEHGFLEASFPNIVGKPVLKKLQLFGHTPARNALRYLETTTRRKPSAVDSASMPGHTTSPPPALQFPDPETVLLKVRDYCLAKGRPENKWQGFATAGYEGHRKEDASLLAFALCSTLLQDYVPYDVRTTADGSTQFSVDVLLPSRRGGYTAVLTSWHFAENKGVSLSTAYVSKTLAPCNPTQTLIEASFSQPSVLWREVWGRSNRYGEMVRGDETQAMGWLWVPLKDPFSRAFVEYARSINQTGIVRRRQGLTYHQILRPGPAVLGETQMHGTLRQAQALLGIAGINSRIEVLLH